MSEPLTLKEEVIKKASERIKTYIDNKILLALEESTSKFGKGGIVGAVQTTDEFIINKKDLYQPGKGGYIGTPQDGLYGIIENKK